MIQSLAKQFDGMEWKYIERHIKKHMPYLNSYLLTDGSSAKRFFTKLNGVAVSVVQFVDDGIHVRAINLKKQAN